MLTGASWSVLHDIIGVEEGLSDFIVFIILYMIVNLDSYSSKIRYP